MAGIKVWYDQEGDVLEITFEDVTTISVEILTVAMSLSHRVITFVSISSLCRFLPFSISMFETTFKFTLEKFSFKIRNFTISMAFVSFPLPYINSLMISLLSKPVS